mmetsp:Transcript_1287/g.3278  ORF Transcript_1287/g.3278 Transcript_1287/m.3278 type:complete len:135 (+) Transcript_1287:120-524(+)
MGDSAYSFSLTTFSRTGKLLQIEYALNAVANGRTSLGICAKDGVVIATDKKLTSELVDVANVHKVELLTPSCGVCYAGVGPDFRVLGEPVRNNNGGTCLKENVVSIGIGVICNPSSVVNRSRRITRSNPTLFSF